MAFAPEGAGPWIPGFRHAAIRRLVQKRTANDDEQDEQHKNYSCRSSEATVSSFAHSATSFCMLVWITHYLMVCRL